jgi:competence transcription factor ComK
MTSDVVEAVLVLPDQIAKGSKNNFVSLPACLSFVYHERMDRSCGMLGRATLGRKALSSDIAPPC